MWHGDDLDMMLMDAAQALDIARCRGRFSDCSVLVAALLLAEEPHSDVAPDLSGHARAVHDACVLSETALHD
jgi:hypothetical protein